MFALFAGLFTAGWCALQAAAFVRLSYWSGLLPASTFVILFVACLPLLCLSVFLRGPLQRCGLAKAPSDHLDWDADLRGLVCVVTGCNAGVGKETAAALAELGATVVMACRSVERAEQAKTELEAARINSRARFAADGSFVIEELDLGRLSSVRAFASRFEKRFGKRCNVLVNNAGLNVSGSTQDGYGQVFQVNYLGHFYLTLLMLPMLQEGARNKGIDSRIVCVSSVKHHFANPSVNVEELEIREGSAKGTCRRSGYSESKLFCLLLAVELQRRNLQGIRAIAVNPGSVMTDIWRQQIPKVLLPAWYAVMRLGCLRPKQGSATSVAAVAAPEDEVPRDAVYLTPYRCWGGFTLPFDIIGGFNGAEAARPSLPEDAEASAKLWTGSLRLIKPVIGTDFINLLQTVSGLKSAPSRS